VTFLLSVAVLATVYVVMYGLERLPALRFRPLSYRRRYFATDVAWYCVAVGITAISVFVLQPVISKLAIGPIASQVAALPTAARILLAFVLFDLVSYAVHRALHRSDALWSFHKVHHSTLELDGLAQTRAHMGENMLRFVPGQIVMFLIGIPVAEVAPVLAVAAIYGVFDHSNLGVNFRWAESVFVTPRLHRRHHVPSTSNKNFGPVFTIWDRMFGTFVSIDTAADERYGVPGEVDTYPQRFDRSVRQPMLDLRQALSSRRADEVAVHESSSS
jgi:sterol desaturase/sphingolipid hydroxylase (fatty acid hydroxylase superfamily)